MHGGQGSAERGADFLLGAVMGRVVAGLAGLGRSVWPTRVAGSPGPAGGMVRLVELGQLVLVPVLVMRRGWRRWRIPPSLRHQVWPVPMGGPRPGPRELPAVAWAYWPQPEPVGVWGLR